jgi:hypothetical protein
MNSNLANSVLNTKSSDLIDRLSHPKPPHDCNKRTHQNTEGSVEKPKTYTVLKQVCRSIQHAEQHKDIINQLRFSNKDGIRISLLEPFKSIFDYQRALDADLSTDKIIKTLKQTAERLSRS